MPTKSIGLRIDEELLAYLEERAEREHRTLSNMIISILLDEKEREYVDYCPEATPPKTNSDYIEREEAILAVDERIKQIGYEGSPLVLSIRQSIRDVPSADVAPVVHGHWERQIRNDLGSKLNDIIICSNCSIAFSSENQVRRSYCPNCGAKMS